MNHWLGKYKLLITNYKPVEKSVIGCDYTNEWPTILWDGYDEPGGPYYYTLVGRITYGIFHSTVLLPNN